MDCNWVGEHAISIAVPATASLFIRLWSLSGNHAPSHYGVWCLERVLVCSSWDLVSNWRMIRYFWDLGDTFVFKWNFATFLYFLGSQLNLWTISPNYCSLGDLTSADDLLAILGPFGKCVIWVYLFNSNIFKPSKFVLGNGFNLFLPISFRWDFLYII